jgi:FtsP/CotA-like multicopper oxidase with cupredoxin domain
MRVSRRALLLGAGAVGLTGALPSRRSYADQAAKDYRLAAQPATVNLTGNGYPSTAVWAYDGTVPGPELRVRQGKPVRITVVNKLAEDTTVHWHGIRLPNAMDGVPGLTQKPVRPGESFTYEFTPPDAGTFWYHPHADTLQQLGRGLAGALIVEEREPIAVDRDLVWFIEDWRLDSDGRIAPGFGNRMEAGMSGRIGNTVTINGRVPDTISVKAGERVRLRLINATLARIAGLNFAGHRPVVVAYDGQPCDAHVPEGGRLVLGPAMRADLILDMKGEPGRRYPVTDDFSRDLAYRLVEFSYGPGKPSRNPPPDQPAKLPANPLPQPELGSAVRHKILLQGGMMSGMGMIGGGGATWAMNGMSMTGDGQADMPSLLTVQKGQSCVLALRNDTAWWHPMHLHGHTFRVIARNGKPNPLREWRGTVLIPPRETADIGFVADNPGDWMFHCHVTDHQMAGMMGVIRVA